MHFRPIPLLTWASLTCSFWLLLPLESMKGEISFICTTFCIVSNVSTCSIANHVGKVLSAHPPPLIHHLSVPFSLFLLLYFLNSALLQPNCLPGTLQEPRMQRRTLCSPEPRNTSPRVADKDAQIHRRPRSKVNILEFSTLKKTIARNWMSAGITLATI